LSTVRIYKVAELLNTTSQEVLALLKKAHGIELKSASSTLEEIVARQFVDRLAKQRGITLPKGDVFSEEAGKAVKSAAAKTKSAPGKKAASAAPEPQKPAVPTLGPPRLIKKARPAEPKPEAMAEDVVEHAAPDVPAMDPVVAAPSVVDDGPARAAEAASAQGPMSAESSPADAPDAARDKAAGRFVPPSIRLRVEEPGKAPPSAPPLQPRRQLVPQPPKVVPPAAPRPPQAPTGNLARPQGPRPPYQSPRPSSGTSAAMLGGPRPLPSQPVRPATGLPPRPGMPGMRPGFRPQQHRPAGPKSSQRRERSSARRRPSRRSRRRRSHAPSPSRKA
jgi:translation initiation factor IF-2